MHDKRVALVTGANQGVGLQVARELVAKGVTVLVGSRDFARGEAAAAEIGPGAIALQLDVTDQASIDAAAERIRTDLGRLDLLVQNAAISNTNRRPGQPIEDYAKSTRPSTVSLDEMRAVWETNVFGVIAVYRGDAAAAARVLGRPHRQCVKRRRIAGAERGPGLPVSRNLRPGLSRVQDRAQRRHAGDDGRAWSRPASRSTWSRPPSPRRTSTAMPARNPSKTAPARWCASRSSARMGCRARSRAGKTKRSRGDQPTCRETRATSLLGVVELPDPPADLESARVRHNRPLRRHLDTDSATPCRIRRSSVNLFSGAARRIFVAALVTGGTHARSGVDRSGYGNAWMPPAARSLWSPCDRGWGFPTLTPSGRPRRRSRDRSAAAGPESWSDARHRRPPGPCRR